MLQDFALHQRAPASVIETYTGKIPDEMIAILQQFGFGSVLQGYLKIVHPDRWQELLSDVYVRHQDAIPLFATAMGDLIVWEKGRYLNLLNFRKGHVSVLASGFDFFLDDLMDDDFLREEVDGAPYPQAIERYGLPTFDECFGYVPLLGLGGAEQVENLKKVKLIEHIYLITQFMGAME
ncbi:DUF1851 domain-containing protein [Tumebacillus sp. DT12]|uniref:DUF1851 domain-containing protein n=1 Tax=Tumebacillus lacus TaxID=2995335 RepID=A0ABT3WX51_9BACL|nr:T6SS immunity protein Tdi1 domain-containing protein [Tumebacillus lacus]MCX7569206.1 DUF1851 domain-containing protein [Tumebacillus lacus]